AAMREKKYSASEIAIAQKALLDPVSRACVSFLHHIDLADYKHKLYIEIARETAKTAKNNGDSVVNVGNLRYIDLFPLNDHR
ncbi:MAG: hypothetical protein HQK65_19355, partial [Desulfamplus sp.]|nr:hypothetical protein [Desulfamplus sp.]